MIFVLWAWLTALSAFKKFFISLCTLSLLKSSYSPIPVLPQLPGCFSHKLGEISKPTDTLLLIFNLETWRVLLFNIYISQRLGICCQQNIFQWNTGCKVIFGKLISKSWKKIPFPSILWLQNSIEFLKLVN